MNTRFFFFGLLLLLAPACATWAGSGHAQVQQKPADSPEADLPNITPGGIFNPSDCTIEYDPRIDGGPTIHLSRKQCAAIKRENARLEKEWAAKEAIENAAHEKKRAQDIARRRPAFEAAQKSFNGAPMRRLKNQDVSGAWTLRSMSSLNEDYEHGQGWIKFSIDGLVDFAGLSIDGMGPAVPYQMEGRSASFKTDYSDSNEMGSWFERNDVKCRLADASSMFCGSMRQGVNDKSPYAVYFSFVKNSASAQVEKVRALTRDLKDGKL